LSNVATLVEELAASVVGADVEDLTSLAAVHERLQKVGQELAEMPSSAPNVTQMTQLSAAGVTEIERIILCEVDNAQQCLAGVLASVADLQKLVNGVAVATQSAPVAEQTAVAQADTHGAASIEAEAALNPDDAPLAIEFIAEANGHIEAAEASLLKLEEVGQDLECVNAIFRSFHTIKGVAGFLNLKQIGALAHAAENLLDLARKGQLELAGAVVDVVLESIDLVKILIAALDAAVKQNQPIATQSRLPGLLDRLHAAAKGEAAPKAAVAAAAATPAPTQEAALAAKSSSANSSDATVKVATERLDSLINMVGELVIAQSMVCSDVMPLAGGNHRVQKNMQHLGKITRELQDLSMSMRMVPIQGVFQKMARLVRDVARKAGKEIDFVVVGGETELDRNVVEAISDPLVHMVRNSVDHGIEPPDKREQAGKQRAGRVQLRAYHQAGSIVIEITDDGRGLNKKRIVEKAIAAGIVKPGQELSDQEIFKLIFHAGLSTADKITDISGRGVGMDVVRKNVEAMRGRIDITSTEGAGSTFTIRLPLTLAVIDGLIVKVGGEQFIIPINSIEQSIRPKADQLSTVQNRGEMCLLRGELMPMFRLDRLFRIDGAKQEATEALVVIVHDNDRRCCLLVDELLGQQQVVIKSLGESLGAVPGVSGGAILGDGSIRLILDVPGLIGLAASGAKQ
jgi:two-component system chemotaxis sensor kinase CheA